MAAMDRKDEERLAQVPVCERAVWKALVAGDMQADAAALADDFLGVYSSGFSGKEGHVGQLADGPVIANYRLSEVQLRSLGEDYALISYRADFLRCQGSGDETMYVSSLWRWQDGGWINIFSQDTAVTS